MAYFRTCALKKRGQVFTRVGLLVDLYSVTVWRIHALIKKTISTFYLFSMCYFRGGGG